MKTIIKFLLGSSLLKSLLLELADKLLHKFTSYILKQMYAQFHDRPFYAELSNFLLDIHVEDFLKENDVEINNIVK